MEDNLYNVAPPTKHPADAFLDAAAELFATGGLPAVTMTAVIRESGAPSGSLYHRFPDRSSLLAGLWYRTIRRYHADAMPLFDHADPVTCAVELARHAVTWCAARPSEAAVLVAGRRGLASESWPTDVVAAADDDNAHWGRAVRSLVRALREKTGKSAELVTIAAVDTPYAAVRRYLTTSRPIPHSLAAVVGEAVQTLLRS